MPTLLTNPRMAPSLRRRIEAQLGRPRRNRPKRLQESSARSPAMFVIVGGAMVVVVALVLFIRREESGELDRRRQALLTTTDAGRAELSDQQSAFLPRVERWVTRLASEDWADDETAADLTAPGALDELFGRPTVYLRGVTPELTTPDLLRDAARASVKDAFLLCLLTPPHASSEAAVLSAVRGVNYGGSMVDSLTRNVRRLHDAEAGLSVLAASWDSRARSAETPAAMKKLEAELQDAPTAAGFVAASAEVLLLVVDDPPPGVGPPPSVPGREKVSMLGRVEERPHEARVAIVDLQQDRLLLRLRRKVDAGARFPSARALHAAAVQGCGLALDVREAVER
ncbi:MAG: hypothetical protein WKG00_10670 [Polyangiaceae bacterium]